MLNALAASLLLVCQGANTIAAVAQVSFSIPFSCGTTSNGSICLADFFRVGQSVVLLKKDNSGVCMAKTTENVNYEGGSRFFEVTRLDIPAGCTGPFSVAVVNAELSTVRPSLEKIPSPTVDKYDKQARELLDARQRSFAPEGRIYRVAERSPKVIAAGDVALLAYVMKTDATRGPHVLFLSGRPFVSKGWCTSGHTFFYVNNRPYLGYVETGCGGGEYAAYVFDLSSGKPEEVYLNTKFST